MRDFWSSLLAKKVFLTICLIWKSIWMTIWCSKFRTTWRKPRFLSKTITSPNIIQRFLLLMIILTTIKALMWKTLNFIRCKPEQPYHSACLLQKQATALRIRATRVKGSLMPTKKERGSFRRRKSANIAIRDSISSISLAGANRLSTAASPVWIEIWDFTNLDAHLSENPTTTSQWKCSSSCQSREGVFAVCTILGTPVTWTALFSVWATLSC